MAKISGTTEQRFTGPVEVMKGSTIKIDNAAVEVLNGKNWKEFGDTVMLNGVDQDVEGMVHFCRSFLVVEEFFKICIFMLVL